MACKGLWECVLRLLNFVLAMAGLAMIGYGAYLLIEWNRVSAIDLSSSFVDHLPKAWFIYLFIGVGVIIFVISCFGCIGTVSRNGCCLSFYAFLVILLILAELGAAAFIYFDHSWKDLIPDDKTGNFHEIYDFLDNNWKIAKWVALGAVILEALTFLLALIVRVANKPTDDDSDDEYTSRSNIRQPLIPRQATTATGIPVSGALDHRPSRNDAWSQRMREKYGLDTAEFTYSPSDPSRHQQNTTPPAEEGRRCIVM